MDIESGHNPSSETQGQLVGASTNLPKEPALVRRMPRYPWLAKIIVSSVLERWGRGEGNERRQRIKPRRKRATGEKKFGRRKVKNGRKSERKSPFSRSWLFFTRIFSRPSRLFPAPWVYEDGHNQNSWLNSLSSLIPLATTSSFENRGNDYFSQSGISWYSSNQCWFLG